MTPLLLLAEKVEGLENELACKVMPYGDHYAATDAGDIWSIARGKWHRLAPSVTPKGYLTVQMTINGRTRTMRVHRVILTAFHGSAPSPKHVARHLNDVKHDNRVCNLAWGTASDNARDAVRNGTSSSASNSRKSRLKRAGDLASNRKLQEADIPLIRSMRASGVSGAKIGRAFGVTKSTISLIIKGKTWASARAAMETGE